MPGLFLVARERIELSTSWLWIITAYYLALSESCLTFIVSVWRLIIYYRIFVGFYEVCIIFVYEIVFKGRIFLYTNIG